MSAAYPPGATLRARAAGDAGGAGVSNPLDEYGSVHLARRRGRPIGLRSRKRASVVALRKARLSGMTFDQIAAEFLLDRDDVEFVLSRASMFLLKPRFSEGELSVARHQQRGCIFGHAVARARTKARKAPGVAAPSTIECAALSSSIDTSDALPQGVAPSRDRRVALHGANHAGAARTCPSPRGSEPAP